MTTKPILTAEEYIELSEFKYNPAMRFYNYIGTSGAEWNYVIGAPANAVSSYSQLISPSASLGITFGWNYLDGLYAIGLGIIQLTDEDDYRTTRNHAKGLLNIVSGIQLFLFSYNPFLTTAIGLTGGAALAPSSFALTMLCDLITAAIDFTSAYKESTLDGWLVERKKEIQFNADKILELENKIKNLDKNDDAEEIKYLEAKCKTISNKNDVLNSQVSLRIRVKNGQGSAVDKENDKAIQNQLNEEYYKARINLFFKAASFGGMTLLAVSGFVSCPPLLMAGVIITTAVALFFTYKNREIIIKSIDNALQKCSFFADKLLNTTVAASPHSKRAMTGA